MKTIALLALLSSFGWTGFSVQEVNMLNSSSTKLVFLKNVFFKLPLILAYSFAINTTKLSKIASATSIWLANILATIKIKCLFSLFSVSISESK